MRSASFAIRPKLEALDDRLVPAVLVVDDDRRQRPSAAFTSIQAAVDAARPGDDIRVYPGTYHEPVTVATDRLTLESVADDKAVITTPAGGVSTAGSGALVTVTGAARGVVIDGFTVRGPGATPGNLSAGIAVGAGASARVTDNTVTDIRDEPLSGNQTGIGILVQGGDAVIDGNTIRRYQKGGIVAIGPGNVLIRDNSVTGIGPTATLAQNGIQVSDGVNALVVGNRVSGNVYTPAGTEASGVVVFRAGRVAVVDNKLSGNEVGVLVEGQTGGLLVSGNRVTGSTLDGISLADSSNALVLGNRVEHSGRRGIAVTGASTDVLVAGNTVADSAAFDLFDDTAPGSNVVFLGNRLQTANRTGRG